MKSQRLLGKWDGNGVWGRPFWGEGLLPYVIRMAGGREVRNPVPGLGDKLFTPAALHKKWLVGHFGTADLCLFRQI